MYKLHIWYNCKNENDISKIDEQIRHIVEDILKGSQEDAGCYFGNKVLSRDISFAISDKLSGQIAGLLTAYLFKKNKLNWDVKRMSKESEAIDP